MQYEGFGRLLIEGIKKLNAIRRDSMDQTHKALAEELGVSSRTIYDWRRGKRLPDPDSVAQLARIFVETGDADQAWIAHFLEKGQYLPKQAAGKLIYEIFATNVEEERADGGEGQDRQAELASLEQRINNDNYGELNETEGKAEPKSLLPDNNGEVTNITSITEVRGDIVRKNKVLNIHLLPDLPSLNAILRFCIGVLLFTVVAFTILAVLVNANRNYEVGFFSEEICLSPPPQTTACPFPDINENGNFPIVAQQCQKVGRNDVFMKTTAELTMEGKLNAETEILTDSHFFGFTGKSTIYFCQGNRKIHSISNIWGVNPRALWGADSHRTINWDCPKRKDTDECRLLNAQSVDENILHNTRYLNIVQAREPSRTTERLKNIVTDIRNLMLTSE